MSNPNNPPFQLSVGAVPLDAHSPVDPARASQLGGESKQGDSPNPAARQLRHALSGYRLSPAHVLFSKFFMLTVDLLTLGLALLVGRLVAWGYHGTPLAHALFGWWSEPEQLRIGVFAAIALGTTLWFWGACGHYTRRRPYWDEVREVAIVVVFAFMLEAMIIFLGKWQFSRLSLGTTWVTALVLLPVTRLLLRRWMNQRGWLAQPYVIIGNGPEALETAAALHSEPLMGFRPIAVITLPGEASADTAPIIVGDQQVPTLELDDELEHYLYQPSSLRVVVVLDNAAGVSFKSLVQRLSFARDDIYIVPSITGLPLHGMELCHFFSHEVLLLRTRNNLSRRGVRFVKRTFDIVGASLALLVLSPLLLAVAVQIRRENGGPVLFSQPRVGYDGHNFRFFKFRSMVNNADQVLEQWKAKHPARFEEYRANNFKLADDPRVTRVGRWIRRTSIDELPQLWNVLLGDMSLVGPRPLLPRELDDYGNSIRIYHHVRPGITGLWQISGRSMTTFEQRVSMDRWYIRNWSLWYDFVIMVRTVRVVLRSEGAY